MNTIPDILRTLGSLPLDERLEMIQAILNFNHQDQHFPSSNLSVFSDISGPFSGGAALPGIVYKSNSINQ